MFCQITVKIIPTELELIGTGDLRDVALRSSRRHVTGAKFKKIRQVFLNFEFSATSLCAAAAAV